MNLIVTTNQKPVRKPTEARIFDSVSNKNTSNFTLVAQINVVVISQLFLSRSSEKSLFISQNKFKIPFGFCLWNPIHFRKNFQLMCYHPLFLLPVFSVSAVALPPVCPFLQVFSELRLLHIQLKKEVKMSCNDHEK